MDERGLKFIRSMEEFCGRETRLLVVRDDSTDPKYGHYPDERPINEHLRFGVINLDKPPGPTSHEVVAWIKQLFSLRKAGHGGTLEP